MQSADISVIIPVYNTERYLAEAVDSVLAQTLAPREVIVVDDGSTDATPEIARDIARRAGSYVRYARQANSGSSAARNHGLRLAQGSMIAFLDADDRYLPTKLERQWRRFADHPELDLCVCEVLDFYTPDLPVPAHPATHTPQSRPGQVSTWLARRALFNRVGQFLESDQLSLAEGIELYLRVRESGTIVDLLPESLVDRRLHDANKTVARQRHLDSITHLMKMRLDRKRGNR